MKRRSREGIIEEILRRGKEPEAKVTQVSHRVDWNTWLAISADLIKKGLLTKRNGYYQTTGRGLEWLEAREKMNAV